jgi:xanthine/uracil permease
MQQGREERSLGELIAELSRDMGRLVRDEINLARTEMTQKASKAGMDIAGMAVGALILYGGFLVLLATAVIVLAHAMAWWLAALIVGIVVVAIGGGMAWYYFNKLSSINPAPRQTVETLKEDKEWMKEQAR